MKKSNTFLLVLISVFLLGILILVINFMIVNNKKIGMMEKTHIQSNQNYELLLKNYEQSTFNYEILTENLKSSDEALNQSIENYQLLSKNYQELVLTLKNHKHSDEDIKKLLKNDSIILEKIK